MEQKQIEISAKESKVQIRPDLAGLPNYVAGKGDSERIVKLSSNELPFHPQEKYLLPAMKRLGKINRYALAGADEVVAEIAKTYGVSTENVAVGNGSIQIISDALTMLAAEGKNVVMPWRSFEAYPILVQIAGMKAKQIPLTAKCAHDLPAMLAAIDKDTVAVMLCSPNNPTGNVLSAQEIASFMKQVPENVLVMLDEAYIEFTAAVNPYVKEKSTGIDGLKLLSDYANLLVLRTFSKAYGMAGLRVGYALGQSEIITAIRKVSTPFGVNAIAQVTAVEILQHREEILVQAAEITQERERVLRVLRQNNWQIPDTGGNFIWFDGAEASLVQEIALKAGVQTRLFPEGLRVSIGNKAENELFLNAIAAIDPTEINITNFDEVD